MSKFKVGDRVRCVKPGHSGRLDGGNLYEVSAIKDYWGSDYVHLVGVAYDPGFFPDRFELVESLKLEVGATVVIDDGKDEWEVTDGGHIASYLKRGGISAWGLNKHLTVVKAKPEPPKPDYYVNCKGERPQDGDVFTLAPNFRYSLVTISDGKWHVKNQSHPLDEKGYRHRPGCTDDARTLLVRDGKPYTG